MTRLREIALAGWIAGMLALGAICPAAPVDRDTAAQVAARELPGFFAGSWRQADVLTLETIDGLAAAYVFVFERSGTVGKGTPAEAVARARTELAARGKPVTGNEAELSAADRYATIFISADDTEPPVLRCFLGLPPQLVKTAEAEDVGRARGRTADWRVRRYLMLGLFDEAFELDAGDGSGETLVVDTRSGTAASTDEIRKNAKDRKVARDPAIAQACRAAWDTHRGRAGARP